MNHGIVGYGNSTNNAKGQWHYSKPSYRVKHYDMHVYLASPNGFEDCFESAQIYNVPNSFNDFNLSYCQKWGINKPLNDQRCLRG
jgi:hypothetical protein